MWKDLIERGRSQMTIWCKRIACWVPNATKTHSQQGEVNSFKNTTINVWLNDVVY